MNSGTGLQHPVRRRRHVSPPGPSGILAEEVRWTPAEREVFLLVTSRPELAEQALTAAAAAGAELVVERDVDSALGLWDGAKAVLLGADVMEVPIRRRGADVLLSGPLDEPPWDRAAGWGVERVVPLPEGLGWLAEFFGGMGSGPDGGHVLGVWGAVGGAGGSSLAAWLAGHAASDGLRTLLIGASAADTALKHALSAEELAGPGWDELTTNGGTVSPERLAEALPSVGGFSLLCRSGEASSGPGRLDPSVVEAARKVYELVVVDIPSGEAEEHAWWCDSVTVVAPLTLNAGLRAVEGLRRMAVTSTGLVARCPARQKPEAQDLAERLGIRLDGIMPEVRGATMAADEGLLLSLGRSRPVRRVTGDLLRNLGPRP
ncbi:MULTISPECIES: septum site-determining protein Ssd [Arthrobacter]|uniref:Septum site-determining protein Ssd n=2 Tax=Arthrobacter TaxID=1663 RepID=A0ABU9KLA1_9MICC|nr:septum site-determining protein Ssd [Arthrobacter sp. YJM1]MDP5227577.1 hypothetical protein [Arthrobacter sp. YJM1]